MCIKKAKLKTQKNQLPIDLYNQIFYIYKKSDYNIVGLFYTHSYKKSYQSKNNIKMMSDLCRLFCRPLLCVIDSGDQILGWWYYQEKENIKKSITYLVDYNTGFPALPNGITLKIKVICPHGKIG